ncbi:SLBB domain-containing protein [candidate division KSB1 bacterium]|nr:SLBB domain-containing protein [candidate division KSB1 bacterium]
MQRMPKLLRRAMSVVLITLSVLLAQETQQPSGYLLGEELSVEMIVHVWGEVKKPGEYRVPYDTDVLELISKAGGPTFEANLSRVRVTRETEGWNLNQEGLKKLVREAQAGRMTEERLDELLQSRFAERVTDYNLDRYLKNKKGVQAPPVLQPGDVIFLPKNGWFRWRELVRVAHEVAIIASVYVWYLRASED